MVSDRDIRTTANSLIKQHGEDAVIHAAMRYDELLDQGDVDGVCGLEAGAGGRAGVTG